MMTELHQGGPPRRILFVCIENSFRSQLAEAFARLYGQGKIEAFSAGSHPSGRVHPQAIESMKELGYDLSRHRSKSLSEIPNIDYDVAVTMGCGDACPMVRAKQREDWNLPDPKGLPAEEVRAIRDRIAENVKALIAKQTDSQPGSGSR